MENKKQALTSKTDKPHIEEKIIIVSSPCLLIIGEHLDGGDVTEATAAEQEVWQYTKLNKKINQDILSPEHQHSYSWKYKRCMQHTPTHAHTKFFSTWTYLHGSIPEIYFACHWDIKWPRIQTKI